MIKMSFLIALILRGIMIIVFDYFQMSYQVQKVMLHQGHINFRKELPKCSQSAGCRKFSVIFYHVLRIIEFNIRRFSVCFL